jgi:hypothetical protein
VYAWAHGTDRDDEPKRTVTVLHVPLVTSPELGVRALIGGIIVSAKKSTKKMGRPKLPKGQAKGRIVPTDPELKLLAKVVKQNDQNTLSGRIRHKLKKVAPDNWCSTLE